TLPKRRTTPAGSSPHSRHSSTRRRTPAATRRGMQRAGRRIDSDSTATGRARSLPASLSGVEGFAIDLRLRPPAGAFLSLALFRDDNGLSSRLRQRGYTVPAS